MTASIIDGKTFAADLRSKVAGHVAALAADHGIVPGLAVVLVGEDPASQVYVGAKGKMTAEVGMRSFTHRLPADVEQIELLKLIRDMNGDEAVHGILVQLPLPDHIDTGMGVGPLSIRKRMWTGFISRMWGCWGRAKRRWCLARLWVV